MTTAVEEEQAEELAVVAKVITEAVAGAFLDESTARARKPHHLGLSALGGCTRAAAYAIAGTEPSDVPPPREGRAANLGTWEHNGLLPRLAARLGEAAVEVPVVLRAAGLEIRGSADLVWHTPALGGVVVDLKTVGERRLHTVRRQGGPFRAHRQQVRAYALAVRQTGREVRWLVWLYMDRATGAEEVVVEPFTNAAALDVLDRARDLRRYADTDPDDAPREERGPGDPAKGFSFACNECPWLRRCWGDDAVPGESGAQAVPVDDNPGIVRAIELLDDASRRKGEAEKDYDYAKALLARVRTGSRQYGHYKLTRGRSYPKDDQHAAVRVLKEMGVEVPQVTVSGRLTVSMVKAKPPAKRKPKKAACGHGG